jgi:hypothetical protein
MEEMSVLLLTLLIGMWVGAGLSYFIVIKPLIDENDQLKINQQSNKKYYNEFQLKQEEYE